MLRVVLAFSLLPFVVAGCGETRHPVRQERIAPAATEEVDPRATQSPAAPMGGEALPPGHPPMSEGMMPGMPPAQPQLAVTPPQGWVTVEPASSMIQAEFSLPKAEGDEADGRVTVMSAGGTVDANVARWRGQFEDLEEKPLEEIDVSGTKATLVDLAGTFNEQRGMMGPSTKRPGYRMLGAIVQRPDGLMFVKAYGPKNTMAANADRFREFVKSVAAPAPQEQPQGTP
ncbi:MAG: hypothetical protein ACYC6Y_20210 [Thermoguttaceae bacterium]